MPAIMVHNTVGLPLSNFIPFKTSQREKLPRTNQRARQESHTTNQNCTVKNRLTCFLNGRVLQKAVKRSLDNSIQRRKCLQDRKLFGGKRWNIKNSEKLSFIGKWPDYSRSMNLSTQNSIARLCTKLFFFDLLFTRHYNDLKGTGLRLIFKDFFRFPP